MPRDRVRDQHEHVIALMRRETPADLHLLRVAHRAQRQRAVHAVEHCSDDRRRSAHVARRLRVQKTVELPLPAVPASPKLPAQRAVQQTLPRGPAEADGVLVGREFGVPLAVDAHVRGISSIPADLLDLLSDPRGEFGVGLVVVFIVIVIFIEKIIIQINNIILIIIIIINIIIIIIINIIINIINMDGSSSTVALLKIAELAAGSDGVRQPRRKGGNGAEEPSVGLSGDFGGDLGEEVRQRVMRLVHLAGVADLREELERGNGEGRSEGGADLGHLLLEAGGAEEVRGAAEAAEERGRRDRLRAARTAQRRGEARRERRETTPREGEIESVVVERFES